MMRTSRDVIFNEAVMATSMNVRNLPEEITTLTTSTEIIEIIEKIPDISDADIADTNDTNITLENIEDAPFENITVEPASVRRSIRHRKATFNAVGIAEAPIISADERESEKEDYLPKAIIAKTIIANEDKPTYEEAMAGSEKSQWRQSINEEIKRIHELDVWELIPKPEGIKIFISK
jgi:hypothetical protein